MPFAPRRSALPKNPALHFGRGGGRNANKEIPRVNKKWRTQGGGAVRTGTREGRRSRGNTVPGCHLIYFSIIKDIKSPARGRNSFRFLLPFSIPLRAGPVASSLPLRPPSLFFPFFSRMATVINQKKKKKKRFKPPVWSGVGTQFSVCQEIKI